MTHDPPKQPCVRHRDDVRPIECPFGQVRRVVSGGRCGVANVHVVKVTKGLPHVHDGYHEAYYFLSGTGTITLGGKTSPASPGTVAIIPAGVPHSLEADPGTELQFVIFGTPPVSLDDARAKPRKV